MVEKIQAALAKARASRQGRLSARASAPDAAVPPVRSGVVDVRVEDARAAEVAAPSREAADASSATVTAAWAALREVRVDPKLMARAHVVTLAGGPSSAAFDVLRTKLLAQARSRGWRRIAITSPGPDCGKSTIALNLAFGLTQQPEVRVILAEVDLRHPTLARRLGFRLAEGIAEVLGERAEPEVAMLRHRTNLGLLTATKPRRNPVELLASSRVGAVLEALEAHYAPTLMIFDLPSMMGGDDVVAFMGHVDAVLIIAATGSTSVREIDRCEQELSKRTNVMGVVLNKCRFLERDDDYAGGY